MTDSVLPLDFHLVDSNGEPLLLLSGAMDLTLVLRNTSPTALFFDRLTEEYHFTLRFRAGVLSESCNIRVAEDGLDDWEVSSKVEEHGLLVDVRHKKGGEWPSGKALEVLLEGFRGDRTRGTRATRVELKYQHIFYGRDKGELLS